MQCSETNVFQVCRPFLFLCPNVLFDIRVNYFRSVLRGCVNIKSVLTNSDVDVIRMNELNKAVVFPVENGLCFKQVTVNNVFIKGHLM